MTAREPFADALRASAVVLVITGQVFAQFPFAMRVHGIALLGPLYTIGDLGLALFFALSGYLVGSKFLSAVIDGTEPPAAVPFLRERFRRIYPAYLCAVILTSAVETVAAFAGMRGFIQPDAGDVLRHALFVHGLSPRTIDTIAYPLWSMPVTVAFYLALPLLAIMAKWPLGTRDRRGRLQVLAVLAALIALGSVALRAVLIEVHPWITAPAAAAQWALEQLPGVAPLFLTGLLFGRVAERIRPSGRLAAGAIVAGAAAFVVYARLISRGPRFPAHVSTAWALANASSVVLLACAAGLLLVGFAAVPAGRLRAAFASPQMRLASELSYSAYLVSFPIVIGAAQLVRSSGSERVFVIALPLALAASAFVAILLFAFVEEPFRGDSAAKRPGV